MPRFTMYEHARSFIAPIRAVSIGGMAHQALCRRRLQSRAADALVRMQRVDTDTNTDRSARVLQAMHAWGLAGAVVARVPTDVLLMPITLMVGSGRHRYSRSDLPDDGPCVSYVQALVDHPLDTGLLGLIGAYNLAKHAMIGGCIGAVLGAAVGLILYLPHGMSRGTGVVDYVNTWSTRGGCYAGAFAALMGSCLIMAPHNYIAIQGLRVLTAVPKLLANLLGYAMGMLVGLLYRLLPELAEYRAIQRALHS